jgi:hypothetical protein
MIRHIIMVKFKPEATDAEIEFLETAWDDFRTRYPGMLGLTWGRDAGLREGNMTIAAVFDFVDEASFIVFDTDAHHNQIRAELPGKGVVAVTRCQFRL